MVRRLSQTFRDAAGAERYQRRQVEPPYLLAQASADPLVRILSYGEVKHRRIPTSAEPARPHRQRNTDGCLPSSRSTERFVDELTATAAPMATHHREAYSLRDLRGSEWARRRSTPTAAAPSPGLIRQRAGAPASPCPGHGLAAAASSATGCGRPTAETTSP